MALSKVRSFAPDCLTGDAYVPDACTQPSPESAYAYDSVAGDNHGIGRLTAVADPSGGESWVYDLRGNVTQNAKTVLGKTAIFDATYDDVDRLETLRYFGGEQVTYGYRADGRLRTLSSSAVYVSDAGYDIFGRLELLRHGNGTDDVATFYGPSENFRLERLTTVRAGATTPYLDLQYHYDARGLIEGIDDLRNPTTDLSNSAAYDIDGLGRLRSVDWLPGASHDEVFDYDPRGNLTLIGGKTLEYPGKPHQALLRSDGTEMLYDSNGSRVQKLTPAETQTYDYDGLGRLSLGSLSPTPTDPPTKTVQFTYDAGGDRVARVTTTNGVAGPPRRYFNRFVDSYNGAATKYYWFGGRVVASQDVVTNALSELPPGWVPPPRELPRLPLALAVPLFGGMLLLLWGPGRRRVSLGVTVAPTRAAGVALAVLASSVPVLMGQQCGGGGGGTPPVRHLHFDHLDSLQAVSDGPGALWRQIRYRSYGLVRGRYDGAGTAAPASEVTRHEFIGYQSEIDTGLDYAYARFYDPELGQFLSHDPAGELPSPYAYTHGDPINFSDPSGQLVAEGLIAAGIFLAKIAIAVYATQVTINYARSGDWGFALDPGNAVTDPVPSQGGVPGLVGGPFLPDNFCNRGFVQVCNTLTIDPSAAGTEGSIEFGAEELAPLGAAIDAANGGASKRGRDPNYVWDLGWIKILGGRATSEGGHGDWVQAVEIVLTATGIRGIWTAGRSAWSRGAAKEGARAADDRVTKEVIERKTLGADKATSRHTIERNADGTTRSVTHQVTRDGQTLHQHQRHIGKYGSEREFPDEWIEHPRIE